MSIGTIAAIGAPILGGIFQGIFGNKAAKTQAATADRQADVYEGIYDQTRSDLSPYRQTGMNAFRTLADLYGVGSSNFQNTQQGVGGNPGNIPGYVANNFILPTEASGPSGGPNAFRDFMGDFEASPDYQFRMQENMDAINAAQNARGGFFSGGTMQALGDRASNVAAGEFGDFYNRRANEFANYTNALSGMANMGQSAAAGTAAAGNQYAAGVSNALANRGDAMAAGQVGFGNSINQGITNALGAYAYMNPPTQQQGGAPMQSPRPMPNPFYAPV